MGYSNWSDNFYHDRERVRAETGTDAFVYHSAMAATPVAERKVHPQMDPKGIIRESRDSDEHPESLAIAVILDETGSMAGTPRVMQQALPALMRQLVDNGCEHPQVLFGAVGDETNNEAASLQIGQFESGIEMDDDLGRIYMEGMGGGSFHESYQNVLYFFARKTSCDCFEKRGVKGKLFLVGDELPYPHVFKHEIEKLFGDSVQDDIPVAEIIREAKEKWDIYFVIPAGTNHAGSAQLINTWTDLLGGAEFVLQIPNAADICTTVTATVTGQSIEAPAPNRNVRL